jgi:hypothetical protein
MNRYKGFGYSKVPFLEATANKEEEEQYHRFLQIHGAEVEASSLGTEQEID